MLPIDPLPHAIAAAALALLWGHAGAMKLRDGARFEGALAAYRLLPPAAVVPIALALPWVELLIAAALVVGASRAWAAPLSAAGLLLYATAIAINLVRGREAIDCGCGGTPQRLHPWRVGRNLLLALVSIGLLLPVADRPLGVLDAATAVMALGATIGLDATLEQWLRNRQSMRATARAGEGGWSRR